MKTKKPVVTSVNCVNQSVNVDQSGNHNKVHIDYQSFDPPDTVEEIRAMRRLLKAQNDLLRVYQKRNPKRAALPPLK